jgi:hypothetical protein
MKVKRLTALAVIIVLSFSGMPATIFADAGANTERTQPDIVISEVQTGGIKEDGGEDAKAEFVELYNQGNKDETLDNWQLDFLTEKHDGRAAPTRVLATLNDITIEAHSYLLISYKGYLESADIYYEGGPVSGYLPKGHGTVRLMDEQGAVADLVGYGSPSNYQVQPVQPPDAGQSIQRCSDEDGVLINTKNNLDDFRIYEETTPGDSYVCPGSQEVPPPVADTPAGLSCEGIIISELLPNPAGADVGKEYIELYNPTDEVIPLDDCSLQTSANSKLFLFESIEMQPGEYRAYYDNQTGLILTNASGGRVWLLTNDATELQQIQYPANMGDDEAWALLGSTWQTTYTLTPNKSNVLLTTRPCPTGQQRNTETNRCQNLTAATGPLTPCKEGQERNLVTNRCRSVLTAASVLKPCAANQVRNPLTNRCKATAGTAGSLAPCKPGQTRNPETNRCKAVKAASTLTPCKSGQERNPQTNRCRKIAGSSITGNGLSDVKDVVAGQKESTVGWWLAGLAALLAIGYGMYEWRQDIGGFLRNLRGRIKLTARVQQ